jgi:hypothetical protein
MTNLKYLPIQSFINEKIKDVTTCKKATSIALGIAISRMLPIPSTIVDSVDLHYATTLKYTASLMVNDFNENIVVDIDLVESTIRSYWMIRYTCAHPDVNLPMISVGEFGFISKINNVGRFIDIDTYKFCDTNSELMVCLVNRISNAMKDKSGN